MNDLHSPAPRDPEQRERGEAFRGALQRVDSRALGVALAGGAFALAARPAYGQTMPSVNEVLNFALTLEYLEREFYDMGIESGVIPSGGNALGKYEEILVDEEDHVTLLQDTLGGDAVEQPEFDFTAGGTFDPFNNYGEFLLLSQGFEDTGVRAYKGGAPALIDSPAILTTALQIHSVEARHASVVRRLVDDFGELGVDQDGWIEGSNAPIEDLSATYAGEDDTTVAGIDVSGTTDPNGDPYSDELITEAYDEPLSMDDVLAIADPFIVDDS